MSIKPASILFDLDGTLVDTAPDFYRVACILLAEENQQPVSYATVRTFISGGAATIVSGLFNTTLQTPEHNRLEQRLLSLYTDNLAVESKLFPGLDSCLEWLENQQIPWGIITNKRARYAQPLVKGLGLSNRISTLICPDHVTLTKPDPEGLILACKHINCSVLDSIYLGDHQRDIEAGNRAGMLTIATTYGYLSANENPENWQADHYLSDSTQLQSLLQSLYPKLIP